MVVDWTPVSHVTKVDPAKSLPAEVGAIAGTDLVMVGGSDNVTVENTTDTVETIREAAGSIPILQEPYRSSQVSRETFDLVDGIAVPAVYNGNQQHFISKHIEFFTELSTTPSEVRGTDLPLVGGLIERRGHAAIAELTEKIIGEGYVIQNPDSRAAEVAGATEPFSTDRVAGTALATESFYRFPIMYIEYSGTYGGTEDVAAAARHLDETVLLYGGGIRSGEQSREILDAGADAVVVGDCFHEDVDRFRDTLP